MEKTIKKNKEQKTLLIEVSIKLATSLLKPSIPSPFFPITIPGLAENIVTVTLSELLSI